MCGVRNAADNLNNWHPLSGIVDQPIIDPFLQGDLTASGDVRPGQYIDKKDKNLGVEDMQVGLGFLSKAIAGGATGSFLAGGADAGAAGAGADFEAAGTSAASQGGASISGGASSDMLAGDPSGDTLDPEVVDPNADPNTNTSEGPASGAFIDATTPTANLSPETAQLLGVNGTGGFDSTNVGQFTEGVSLSPGGGSADGIPTVPDTGPVDIPGAGASSGGGGYLDQASQLLKKLGLSPASAGLLGVSAIQGLTKPKTPAAANSLSGSATQGAQQAQSVIQSGGQASPAWTSQKSSIDATIDQQLQQQTQAILQQAQNSGQGADSQVTVQQINKLKTQLETQRQTLYSQAQGQNVQAALQQLGISDQALSGVAAAQYKASQDARSSAGQTAALALQLQALSGRNTGGGSAGIVPNGGQATG